VNGFPSAAALVTGIGTACAEVRALEAFTIAGPLGEGFGLAVLGFCQ
jgi:hypothetical protein